MDGRGVGIQPGVDPRKWAALLRRAHAAAFAGGRTSAIVRAVIADSWKRSAGSGVQLDGLHPPLALERADARDRWEAHPLARATDIIEEVLAPLLLDSEHVAVISDAEGTLLWSAGHPTVLRAADVIGFSPGRRWSEAATGTNAVGTALAIGRPIQVFSAEHYRPAVHAWQCSAAPVRDPRTREILGAIDISGAYAAAHPLTLALVQTAARLAEELLRRECVEQDASLAARLTEHVGRFGGPAAAVAPDGRVVAAWPRTSAWPATIDPGDQAPRLPDGTRGACTPLGDGRLLTALPGGSESSLPGCISLLRAPVAVVTTARGERQLSLRHSEIVALLTLNPDGLTGRQLAEMLHADPDRDAGLRVELHRLRRIIGPALATRPYRLRPARTDLTAALEGDRDLCSRLLLPASSVPLITATRRQLAELNQSAA